MKMIYLMSSVCVHIYIYIYIYIYFTSYFWLVFIPKSFCLSAISCWRKALGICAEAFGLGVIFSVRLDGSKDIQFSKIGWISFYVQSLKPVSFLLYKRIIKN